MPVCFKGGTASGFSIFLRLACGVPRGRGKAVPVSGTDGHGPAVPPEPFSVDIRPDRGRVVVVPHGELDIATVDGLAAEIDELARRGFEAIVLDLRAMSFIDSSGIHLLVKQMDRGDARVTLIDGGYQVRRVIELAGVRELLRFEVTP
jgi:anti-sigma B factor antagonist